MSKRNRNKFRNREAARSVPSPASPVSSPMARPSGSNAAINHAAEYRIISKDLIRLVILNAVILVAVFALYYANQQSGFVERLYGQIF